VLFRKLERMGAALYPPNLSRNYRWEVVVGNTTHAARSADEAINSAWAYFVDDVRLKQEFIKEVESEGRGESGE
jgi:hypothetical protein